MGKNLISKRNWKKLNVEADLLTTFHGLKLLRNLHSVNAVVRIMCNFFLKHNPIIRKQLAQLIKKQQKTIDDAT